MQYRAEIGRDHDLIAASGKRLGQSLFRSAASVDVGGVEEVGAEIEREVEGSDELFVVDLAPAVRLVSSLEGPTDRPATERAYFDLATWEGSVDH